MEKNSNLSFNSDGSKKKTLLIASVITVSIVAGTILMLFAFLGDKRTKKKVAVDMMKIEPYRFHITKRLPLVLSNDPLKVGRSVFNASIGRTPSGKWFSLGRDCTSTHLNTIQRFTAWSSALWSNFYPENLQNKEYEDDEDESKYPVVDPWSRNRKLNLVNYYESITKKGGEDARVFNWGGQCYVIYTAKYQGKNQMHVAKLDIKEDESKITSMDVIKESTVILSTEDGKSIDRTQKNWIAWDKGDGILRFIYAVTDGKLSILKCPSLEKGVCSPEPSGDAFTLAGSIRKSLVLGSSSDLVLAMGHRLEGLFHYYNVFYLFTKTPPYKIVKVSNMVLLRNYKGTFTDFDYIMSAVFINDQLVVSGGRGDIDCFYVSVTIEELVDLVSCENTVVPFLSDEEWLQFAKSNDNPPEHVTSSSTG